MTHPAAAGALCLSILWSASGCGLIVKPPGQTGGGGTGGGNLPADGGPGGAGNRDGGLDAAGGGTPPRGPTPARAGLSFPFPQNREQSRCVYPSAYLNADVTAAFDKWKADTVTSNGANGFRRVQRLATDPVNNSTPLNSTVSEGIAYGMLIAVYMGDQALFDDLWKYEQRWTNANGLMDWAINAAGTARTGTGAATDADEDMAFALVMADRQWGGRGTLERSYIDYARTQIQAIWNFEILEGKLLRNGDGWGDWNNLNISYFAPYYYRVFKQVDGNAGWDAVIETVYDTIDNALAAGQGNATNGLVPAWCSSQGAAVGGQPFHYQYDSCRTPFRIGMDWCLHGETRARDYVAKTSGFFSNIGAAAIVDGYNLDGTPRPQYSPASGTPTLAQQSAAFLGPAAVGAMSNASYRTFLDAAYMRVATSQALVGGAYYDESWTVISLLMLTANLLDYTKLTPAP
jgi:endo-1,4-beta-D-glucanase Y